MKPIEVIGITVGGLLLYNLFAKRQAATNLNFFPAAVKDIHFDGSTPVISLGIAVQNTSNQQFNIRSMAGNLFSENNGQEIYIGNFSSFTSQVVYPNSQVTLWVNVRLSLIGAVTDILNSWKYGTLQQNFKLKANMNVDSVQVPLVFDYKLL